MKKILIPAITGIFAITLIQCTPKMHKAVSGSTMSAADEVADVKKNFTADQVHQGMIIYTSNCGKCHKLKDPSHYSVSSWNNILPKMTHKAKLSDSAATLVRAYVLMNAAAQ